VNGEAGFLVPVAPGSLVEGHGSGFAVDLKVLEQNRTG